LCRLHVALGGARSRYGINCQRRSNAVSQPKNPEEASVNQAKNSCGLRAFAPALCRSLALAIGIASFAPPAVAQTYPSRPITLIVPVNPGGPNDVVARLVALPLSKFLGQSVVVENRAGASQKIGIRSMLNAPRDGYTISVVSPASMTINPLLDRTVGYDPLKDITFLTEAVSLYYVLVVNPSLPVRSLQELVAYSKANPDKLAYGTGGSGTLIHFATQQALQKLGITVLPVHYKGDGPALMDLLSGQIQLMLAGTGVAKPYIDGGKLVALATSGPERLAELPNVTTYRQSGIKELEGFTTQSWVGFVAAAGIPPEAARKLHDALVRSVRLPEVAKSLEVAGFQVVAGTPNEFAAMVRSSIEENRKVIESGAIKPE
jgi:tripartite-type tricarboxylate transporter receptor subunit TctC